MVLNEIESWANDPDKSPVYWLNGLAGTGKSTIAQTIAELFFAEGRLGASFFCSRDFEDRRNLHLIFPTLAFQLAHKYPDFRSHFVPLLRSNPGVVHESLYSQMQKLITEPLREAGISTVIVIDALDECRDDEPSSTILSVLGRFVEDIPEVRFFITGRPEPRIETGFRLTLLADSTDIFVLHNVQPSLVENDIRIFFKHELSELARRRRLEGWPSDEHIDLLCRRAAGLFVYAVATVKFLESRTHLTEDQLDIILKLPESTAPEGKTRFNPSTSLDSLYTSILQAAFCDTDINVYSKVRTTVGTVVLVVNPLPPPAIAQLTGLKFKEVMLYLTLIQSLLAIGDDSNQPVKPFHKSFPDFITDPSRCTDTRFYTCPTLLHLELAINCLRLMNDELEEDLLSLPEYSLNSGVEDLQTRIDGRINLALQYACRSWHNHLTGTKGEVTDVIPYLREFLESKFLAWLEVLSVLGDMGSASVGLEKLMEWLREVCFQRFRLYFLKITRYNQVAKDNQLLDTTRDCFYFTTKFFEPINVSATHIYHSALELCPLSSIVRKLYYDRCHGVTRVPRVVIGTPDSWDTATSVSGKHDYGYCTWSPCGQFIAAPAGETVEIRNHLTFELVDVFQFSKFDSEPRSPLTYSPDGRSIACGFLDGVVIWDIQTGGVAGEISCGGGWYIDSVVWSSDGMTVAITHGEGDSITGVETYDVFSGAQLFKKRFESGPSCAYLWPHENEKSFRLMVGMKDHSDPTLEISISEIGPNLIEIKSQFSLPANGVQLDSPSPITFCPSTYHISFVGGALYIFDIRTSDCLLELKDPGLYSSIQFSPDGSHFASFGSDNGLHIFRWTSGSYTLLWKFPSDHEYYDAFLQFSPTSSSILSQHYDILKIWRLSDPPIASETRDRYTAVTCSGCRIATVLDSETTVLIIDLHSQTPSQFIDTGFDVKRLEITGNVLVAGGSGITASWLLTEEGTVDGVFDYQRAGESHRKWTLPALPHHDWHLSVEGVVGIMRQIGQQDLYYHTETGDVLWPGPQLSELTSLETSEIYTGGRINHYLYRLPCLQYSPEDDWQHFDELTSGTAWVMNPEGGHKFWLPVEWRRHKWYYRKHEFTSLTVISEDDTIVIKLW